MSVSKGKLLHSNNFFDSATRGSDKKLNIVATDFNDKLAAETSIPTLTTAYNTVFKPAYLAFKTSYTDMLVLERRYKDSTAYAESLWEMLRKNADEWSFQIEATPGGLFRRGTRNYTAIFTNGYSPLQNGSYENRVRELKALANITALYPDLADVTNDINAFYQTLLTTRSEQQGFEYSVANGRVGLDNARTTLVAAMYRLYCFLGYTFAPDMNKVESFFDVSMVRNYSRNNNTADALTVITVDILPLARRTAITANFSDTATFEISNTGNTAVAFWTTNNENSAAPIGAFVIGAGDTMTVNSDELSDGSNDLKYLIAENQDAVNKAKIAITVV
jgi:hypothetical protein